MYNSQQGEAKDSGDIERNGVLGRARRGSGRTRLTAHRQGTGLWLVPWPVRARQAALSAKPVARGTAARRNDNFSLGEGKLAAFPDEKRKMMRYGMGVWRVPGRFVVRGVFSDGSHQGDGAVEHSGFDRSV
jgi:hypothetical protein